MHMDDGLDTMHEFCRFCCQCCCRQTFALVKQQAGERVS